MKALLVEIIRYISNEPQPGIVECRLIDANGVTWTFIEKTAVVSDQQIDEHSVYPQSGVIACEIVAKTQDESGSEILLVDTTKPWGVTTTTGESKFKVRSEQIIDMATKTNTDRVE